MSHREEGHRASEKGLQCLWQKDGHNAKTPPCTHLETFQMVDPDFKVSDINYFRSKFSGHRLQVAYSAHCWTDENTVNQMYG